MKSGNPHILLVNPWIHDFAAYDFWAKPLGLLTIASILRVHGARITYIDCLDRFHSRMPFSEPSARFGRGPYLKTRIDKPDGLGDVRRNYSRYGILSEWFSEDLKSIPRPDVVLITSMMTYWYPGVQETIIMIRRSFPEVPVVLGGIYATLCSEHAVKFSGADIVVEGEGEEKIFEVIRRLTGWSVNIRIDADNLDTYPFPAFDLYKYLPYVALLTSKGCPFSCRYCASDYLNPKRRLKSADRIVEEIRFWKSGFNTMDMVFYDDALLVDPFHHAVPILEKIIESGLGKEIRFHTPNAVHIREITHETARLMAEAGFKTLRLGLETASADRNDFDRKVTRSEFISALSCLKAAGFEAHQIGAYLLTGLPGQGMNSVADSIDFVLKAGIMPVLAYYTPIPHTALWSEAVSSSRYDLESDPVFTNNAIFPCQKTAFDWAQLERLKKQLSIKTREFI